MTHTLKKRGLRRPLVLASASARRAELLSAAGYDFTVIVSPSPEPTRKPAALPVELWPMCLAYLKAAAVLAALHQNQPSRPRDPFILAADTIVVLDGQGGPHILNKPADRAHARRMLHLLSGKSHRVITGICLLSAAQQRLSSAQAVCKLRNFSPPRLQAYLDSGLWKGKAGAYGIQDQHDPLVTLLKGDVTTVIGLPMFLVKRELACFEKE